MKHNIQCWWIPSTQSDLVTNAGNNVYVGGVSIESFNISQTFKVYQNNGVGAMFWACEIKPESSERQEFSRNLYGVQEVMYIQSDRDLPFKEDDLVQVPLMGTYKIVATDNSRVRPIKNGFKIQNVFINITMVKQNG